MGREVVISVMRLSLRFGLLLSAILIASCSDELPSSAELARTFPAKHAALDTLRQMSNQDARVVQITPSRTLLDSNYAWPRPDSLLGISHARWDQYRRLFKRVGSENGLGRGPDGSVHILIKVSSFGLGTSGGGRGYLFSPSPPAPLGTPLESLPRRKGLRYQPLTGGWYIFDHSD